MKKKKKSLNMLVFMMLIIVTKIAFSQERTIKGKVSDAEGLPIPGATVVIKGTKQGTQTDFDGNFLIKVNDQTVLVFSYVGMQSVEKTVGQENFIQVTLKESKQELSEIVIVSTGYDRIDKKKFTGAANTIKASDFKIDGVVDVSRMLEGRVAGLNIQNVSGTFGAASQITIRGNSSIFGNNTPLYVIDGVVQEDIIETDLNSLTTGDAETLISSSIAGINASDIQKIDILKDASATAIYGARARNGVIVITTKSGRKNTPLVVRYNMEQTLRDIPHYSQYDILDSKENIAILKEMEAKGWLELPNVAQGRYGGIYYIMADRINTYDAASKKFLLENTPEAKNKFLQPYELGNTNWFKHLFRNSIQQTHTLSLSGGGEKNTYYTSLSFMKDPGWSIAENVSRITANIKNTTYFSDRFSATVAANIAIRKQRAPGTFGRQRDVVRGSVSRNFDINPFSYALNTSRTLRPKNDQGDFEYYRNNWAKFNILEEIDNNYIDLNQRDLRILTDLSWKINDKFTWNGNAAIRYVNSVREHKMTEKSNVIGAYNANETTIIRDRNIFLYQDPNDPDAIRIPVLPRGGLYLKDDNYLTSYYLRNSLKYDDAFFDEKLNLNLFAGQEIRYVDRDKDHFKGYGLQYDNGYVPFTDPRMLEGLISGGENYFGVGKTRERTVAFFGKASIAWDNKYVLLFTGRYDGSNRQGRSESSRWLPTGTISAKWNAINEPFMNVFSFVSDLQFRISYGLVATPGPATNSLAIFKSETTDRLLPSERENSIYIQDLQNASLTWEKQYELNLGGDLGLFNDRIKITGDIYNRNIFDNVDYVNTSGIGGEKTKTGNNATVNTIGIEFSLNTKNIDTNDFSWSTNFNFSYFWQKIVKLADKPTLADLVDSTGGQLENYPTGALFSIQFEGLNEEGLPKHRVTGGGVQVGGINYQHTQNLHTYLVYEGSIHPNITGGFSNKFNYKNWSLDILITGAGGNKIRLKPMYSVSYSDLKLFSRDFKNRWVLPGDEKITNIPVIPSKRLSVNNNELGNAYNAYNYSTERVADGSFVRLKNIGLTYRLPLSFTEKFKINNLSIRVQATNIALLYADKKLNGQDPEFFRSGGVSFPIRRQYTLSINVGF